MPSKLVQGEKLPAMTLNLTDGRSIQLPGDMSGRCLALLFYRGKW